MSEGALRELARPIMLPDGPERELPSLGRRKETGPQWPLPSTGSVLLKDKGSTFTGSPPVSVGSLG